MKIKDVLNYLILAIFVLSIASWVSIRLIKIEQKAEYREWQQYSETKHCRLASENSSLSLKMIYVCDNNEIYLRNR